jgi:uncharacterized repeat protein (TIGR01451 family)
MNKLMIVLLSIAMVAISAAGVYAQTPSGTTIGNTASVTAGNVPSSVTTPSIDTNVNLIVGAEYDVIPADTQAAPGDTVNLIFDVINRGNANDSFSVSISNFNETTNDVTWTATVLDSALGNPFAVGNTVSWTLQVYVGATESDGNYMEFTCLLVSDNAGSAKKSGSYTNDNPADASVYCGDMGVAWAGGATNDDGTLRHAYVVEGAATSNSYVRVTVSGPILSIIKTIADVSLGGSGGADLVPGATITYNIIVSNTGSGTATDVVISDPLPGNTTYVAGSANITSAVNPLDWSITAGAAGVFVTNTVSGLETTNGGGGNGEVILTFDVTVD